MFNRLKYIKGECTHQEYYSQFVNNHIIKLVVRKVGVQRILDSEDLHFNDIPLSEWDALNDAVRLCVNPVLWKSCNNVTYREEDRNKFLWSLSDGVCIAKAAAKIIKENTVHV